MRSRRAAVVLALAASLLVPSSAGASERILGGPRIAVTAAPYVAAVELTDATGALAGLCTGAVIDQRRVLTSAHCFEAPFRTSGGAVRVGSDVGAPAAADAGAQVIPIAAVRTHPGHVPGETVSRDDIAVVTLSSDIAFGPRVQPIGLVAPNAYPAAGAALAQAGYGNQLEAPTEVNDGYLHARFAQVRPADTCGPDNAVLLCYGAAGTAECSGDSGSPVVVGGLLAAINSGGDCSPGGTGEGASLAAPEIRAFVDGSATPPRAPVETGLPAISGAARVGGTATCRPGAWTGATSFVYAFEDARDGSVVQLGAAPTRVLAPSDVGRPLRCRVGAVSAGGIGQDISGTLPAVAPAPAVPVPTTTTTTPVPTATVARPALTLTPHATIRRRTRSLVRLQVRTGPTAIGASRICLTVSSRAKVVASRGRLRAKVTSCRALSAQAARTRRTITFRVRPTRRGAVRISATLTYPGGTTPVRAARTVRAR